MNFYKLIYSPEIMNLNPLYKGIVSELCSFEFTMNTRFLTRIRIKIQLIYYRAQQSAPRDYCATLYSTLPITDFPLCAHYALRKKKCYFTLPRRAATFTR